MKSDVYRMFFLYLCRHQNLNPSPSCHEVLQSVSSDPRYLAQHPAHSRCRAKVCGNEMSPSWYYCVVISNKLSDFIQEAPCTQIHTEQSRFTQETQLTWRQLLNCRGASEVCQTPLTWPVCIPSPRNKDLDNPPTVRKLW